MLLVVAVLLVFGAGSASPRSASQGAQEPGSHGGPKSGECEDGDDNDGDGLIDADDPACQQPGCLPSSQTPQKCFEHTLSPENPEAGNCADGIDNDGDGLTDGDDPDCATTPPDPGTCANGLDDDEDGDVDGDDSDCQGEGCVVEGVNTCDETTTPPPDTETSCDNGIDDDGDGLTDLDDPDCQTPENPGAGNCADGVDNDGDGLTDGDDPDCQTAVVNLCTAAFEDPGLLTEDTLGQTLYDSGLDALSPLTEDPERNGAISGPLGDALTGTPIEVIGDEASCLVDLLLDEDEIPFDL